MKLLHSGLQDERLLPPRGQPLPFTQAFVRSGRFTTEWYRVDFDNRPAFGTTAKATLPRRGHLITRVYLVATMPDIVTPQLAARGQADASGVVFAGPTFGWTNSIGHALIANTQMTIGGNTIDSMDGRLLEILDEFHTPLEKLTTTNRLLGRYDNGFTPRSNGWDPAAPQQLVAVNLPFWFNRGDPSNALPIDAIGTDPVQLTVTFNQIGNLYTTTARTLSPEGKQTLPAMLGSSFFYLDESQGLPLAGLNGNPGKSVAVQTIPGDIRMPTSLEIPNAYLLLEYVYLDKPEANRIRLGNIDYPIVQHYAITPGQTRGGTSFRNTFRIPNPARDLYFFLHRNDADLLNAPFLATRDLSGLFVPDISGCGPSAPWWPDASGLTLAPAALQPLIPAYSDIDSEPITSLALIYEGKLVRYASDAPAFFRSILPSIEKRKTPWHNKYFYHFPFGTRQELYGITNLMGHANLDKIHSIELALGLKPARGSTNPADVPSYTVYMYAETLNILKVFGGRAGLLMPYSQNFLLPTCPIPVLPLTVARLP